MIKEQGVDDDIDVMACISTILTMWGAEKEVECNGFLERFAANAQPMVAVTARKLFLKSAREFAERNK